MASKKRQTTTKLSDAIASLGVALPDLSDEQWEARDAKIAAATKEHGASERNTDWQNRKAKLIENGLAPRHLEHLFAGKIDESPAIERMAKFAGDGVCVMSGNVGCGKTFAAHVWLLDAMNVEPTRWKFTGIRMATAAWFARQSRYGSEKFELLAAPTKLVIDDLGVEYFDEKGSFLVDLDELLDLRWRNKVATVITTNLTSKEFKARYGDRIYDRARGADSWCDVRHPSMRGK